MRRCFDIVIVEGNLETHVMERLLRDRRHPISEGLIVNKRGQGNFWTSLHTINRGSGLKVAALADLENARCPGALIRGKLRVARSPFLTLNLAVRMLESWLLADPALAVFLGVPENKLPQFPEDEPHAKRCLLSLVKAHGKDRLKRTFLGPFENHLFPGPDYEPLLARFIRTEWNPGHARARSPSLGRALDRLDAALR